MRPLPVLFLATSIAIPGATVLHATSARDRHAFHACLTAPRSPRIGVCRWRTASLAAFNGWIPTRLAFVRGHPREAALVQPGTAEQGEFIPDHTPPIPLHIADGSTIDGTYLVCPMPSQLDPYDPPHRIAVVCLAGARNMHAGRDPIVKN